MNRLASTLMGEDASAIVLAVNLRLFRGDAKKINEVVLET
jgi:hypothetical protein